MEIKPVNYEYNRKRRLKPDSGEAHPRSIVQSNAGLCDNDNRGYSVNFSGSHESVGAAKSFMGRIMNTKTFRWLTGFAGAHNVAAAALVGLFLAGGLRPLITISLPGKNDMEDKIYAAGHSMASGLIGFAFSTLITTPIDSGTKYILEDAKKISKEDYNELSIEELSKYIRKNNVTPEDIAKKMKSKGMTKEEILKHLKNETGENLSFDEMARFVKENNIEIMPVRKFNNNFFKIVSSKTDQINKLKHEMHYTTDTVKKGKILGEVRDLENWIKGIETSAKNVSEWAIAIPRAALTIALIPPILKYVFHVEKNKPKPQEPVKEINPTNMTFARNNVKSLSEFKGGGI